MTNTFRLLLVLALTATVSSTGYVLAGGAGKGDAVPQKWEYKIIFRGRTAAYDGSARLSMTIGDWTYREDGKEIGATDLVVKLRELGEAGWELVAIAPQSTGTGSDFAGFTSEMNWVFKRPK